ncbi:SDR family oxidoreductase [Legionella brunensis]|uniref:Acetyoacetyl CoA reductase n=1 Tax=Legionella brunensis TaxID=29422 RepID=A0A0W0SU60_9GAMM|nr:SDR family oxidoreductase [Legionella brunensis]KTC86819.1 acetyoacetyl CoA reductase [Legionella brunensis]
MCTLNNKVALITGSSRGIGASIAKHLAGAGASVVINYASNSSAATTVVNEIKAAKGRAIAVKADVGSSADITKLFDAAIDEYGKLDILINNAGIVLYKQIKDTSEEEFDKLLRINLKGVFFALKEAATRLADRGSILNISSTVTRLLMPTYGGYSASKVAVEQLTRVFAKEVGERGIRVNTILPGATNTELFTEGKTPEMIQKLAGLSAFNRIGEPEDIAKAALFLVSDEAGWITAQTIGVNGGIA